jgi:hypothetical protein
LKKVINAGRFPPVEPDNWVDDWQLYCGEDSTDPLEIQAALLIYTRADNGILTPVYDIYNHRNGQWFNTESHLVLIDGVQHEVKALQEIEAGEEIYLSYNQFHDCEG